MDLAQDIRDRLNAALVGRYTLDRELGRGGMAWVFLAADHKHGRQVAIKVLKPDLAAALGADRFLREIGIAARLRHPHILPLHDSGEADGLLYYTMPYVEGESLRDRLEREQQLPLEEALAIARDVADALSYAHGRGIVHRDIKPENILLDSGHAVVSDFGVARAVAAAGGRTLTETGLAIGTPLYMSPEQASGTQDPDPRSDQYSLGCVLYEMLTGEPPHTGATPQMIIARRLGEKVSPIGHVRDAVPDALDRAVLRSLSRTPADRFAGMAEFRDALVDAMTGPAERTVASARWSWRRAIAGAALVGLGVAAWLLLPGRRDAAVPAPAVTADPAVAVLPFRTVGEDIAYWREGIVDLLSFDLEGIAGLRKIDPATVLTAWRRLAGDGTDAIEPQTAVEVARQVGARYVVTGSAVDLGSGVQLTAEVHDAVEGGLRGSARVHGDPDSLSQLVDGIVVELLRENIVPADPDYEPVNLGRVTTRSLPALKAYLAGEREYRAANFTAAARHYQRALEIDSAFPRAVYRLSLAFAWGGGPANLASEYQLRAARLADRLPERDAMLIRGVVGFDSAGAAELEELTGRYPDDVEAWVALADNYFHVGGVNLRPTSAFRRAFEHALALHPYYGESYQHLIEDAFARLDSARARELIDDYAAIGGYSGCAYLVSWDLVWGSAPERERVMAVLDTISANAAMFDCVQSPLAAPPEVLDRMAEVYRAIVDSASEPFDRTIALWRLLQVRVPRGQIAAARRELARVEGVPVTERHAARWQIMLHLSVQPDSAAAASALALLAVDPEPTDRFWAGAVAVAERRWADVTDVTRALERQAEALQRDDDPLIAEYTAGYAAAYAAALRAWAGLERGDFDQLAAFEAALRRLPPASYHREQPQQFLRYRVATILFDVGRMRDAERYFRSFQPYDYFYTSQAELLLGRICEALERPGEAVEHYRRFVTWWEVADPPLQPMRQQALDALGRLSRESAG